MYFVEGKPPLADDSGVVREEDDFEADGEKVPGAQGVERSQAGLLKRRQATKQKAVDTVNQEGLQLVFDGGLVAFDEVSTADDAAGTGFHIAYFLEIDYV